MLEEGTIWDHLRDIRNLFIKITIVVVIGAIIGLIFNQQLIDFYLDPLKHANGNIPPHVSPLGPMMFRLQVAMTTSIALSFPIIIIFLWQYIAPILREKERKFLGPYILSFLVLASIGLVYGYFMLLPQSLGVLLSYVPEGTDVLITVDEYMSFVSMIFVATILTFQTPIVVFTLIVSGLIPKHFFDTRKKETYFIIIVLLAIITPTNDLFTLGMIVLPVIILFEISLFLAKFFLRNQPEEHENSSEEIGTTNEGANELK